MENTIVFFNGKLMRIREAIPAIMKMMIEEDVKELPDFIPGDNPYNYVHKKLYEYRNKPISVSGMRNWCYEKGKGGALPTLEDFLYVIKITKSKKPLLLIGSMINENEPEEQSDIYGSVFNELGDFVVEMGKNIKALAPNYFKNPKVNVNKN